MLIVGAIYPHELVAFDDQESSSEYETDSIPEPTHEAEQDGPPLEKSSIDSRIQGELYATSQFEFCLWRIFLSCAVIIVSFEGPDMDYIFFGECK